MADQPDDSTLSSRVEAVARGTAEKIALNVKLIRAAHGERPAFGVDLTRDEEAQRWLPLWWVFGQAAPGVAAQWWLWLIKEKARTLGEPKARKEAVLFDRAMRRLNEQKPLHALVYMSDQMRTVYEHLQQMGLHSGRVQPMLEATDLVDPRYREVA